MSFLLEKEEMDIKWTACVSEANCAVASGVHSEAEIAAADCHHDSGHGDVAIPAKKGAHTKT